MFSDSLVFNSDICKIQLTRGSFFTLLFSNLAPSIQIKHLPLKSITHSAMNSTTLSKKDTTISILIIGMLFFIFGFVSWVNSILIPYFKIACELNHFESYLVTFAFYISYFVMSVPSSYLLKKVGFKKAVFPFSIGSCATCSLSNQ